MSNTQQIERPAKGVRDYLTGERFRQEISLALPKHITPERFTRIALTALSRKPKLMECTPASVLKCCMDLSALGLEPDGRRAHLIPYKNECTLVIDYKGLIELAKRSGEVKRWRAEIVKERDKFEWENGHVSHVINWREDRGASQCYYSHVTLADGTDDYEVMTLAEVEAIRRRSRSANDGPWVTDFDEMAKKTVMRRHSKRLTLSPEFHDAVAKDDEYNGFTERNVTPRVRPNFGAPLPPPVNELPDPAPEPAETMDPELARELAVQFSNE